MTATQTRQDSDAEVTETRQPRLTMCGLLIATALVALTEWGGAHVRIGLGLPHWAGVIAGALALWLALAGLAWWAAELLRAHHRAVARAAWRGGRRGAAWTGGRVRRHGGWLAGVLAAWARERWRRRETARGPDGDGGQADDAPGAPAAPNDPAAAPAAAAPARNGDPAMTTTTNTKAAPQRAAPAGWKALAAETGDFEPADDAELLDWMASQVAGMLGYGEAIADVHEHCVQAVRLDPAAMAALHDVADAVADAAEAMARAREKFVQVYQAPREFVGDGGVLPKDGDFLTGEGD